MPAFLDYFNNQIYHSKQVISSRLIAPIHDFRHKIMGKGLLPVPMHKIDERVNG